MMHNNKSRLISFLRALSVFGCLYFCQTVSASDSTVIRFYGESAAPFYWEEEGVEQGAVYDLANALIAHLHLNATVELLPWARAYYEAEHHPNVVLLSVLKTPARENDLQWLGVVHVAKASFIRLRERADIEISEFHDAKKYRVGTVRGYGSAGYLQRHGFKEYQNLILAKSPTELWSLLYKKRIDLVLSNLVTGKYEVSSAGLDPIHIVSAAEVEPLNLELQMATGPDTSVALTEKLRAGLASLKASGEYRQIMEKWALL
ncbi:substrate-binding periplasmic protein [Alteromonas sp. H39]|uniref:substrate-binding periplasmic protein n=1 Tax=Alteromonas sp. H39 TaxID=3389876 RepID=UPI0039E11B62